MTFLYIFPHPDDESFGPAAAIHAQLAQGHDVHLLTLTKGGATKQRVRLNLSVEEMNEVRYQEMLEVEKTLQLSSMTVLDFPDGGLAELDPRKLEQAVAEQFRKHKPAVVVTYPVHGISGHADHLVTHAIVKRAFLTLRPEGYLKRLAFFTVPEFEGSEAEQGRPVLNKSKMDKIDCIMHLEDADTQAMKDALSCYKTYQSTIQEHDVVKRVGNRLHFEIYQEDFKPPLSDLSLRL